MGSPSEKGRGDAAAPTWLFRGSDAAAPSQIVRGRSDARGRRRHYGPGSRLRREYRPTRITPRRRDFGAGREYNAPPRSTRRRLDRFARDDEFGFAIQIAAATAAAATRPRLGNASRAAASSPAFGGIHTKRSPAFAKERGRRRPARGRRPTAPPAPGPRRPSGANGDQPRASSPTAAPLVDADPAPSRRRRPVRASTPPPPETSLERRRRSPSRFRSTAPPRRAPPRPSKVAGRRRSRRLSLSRASPRRPRLDSRRPSGAPPRVARVASRRRRRPPTSRPPPPPAGFRPRTTALACLRAPRLEDSKRAGSDRASTKLSPS